MQDHTGWRATIGVVCAAANIVVEPEFYAMSEAGVATCAGRMRSLDEASVGALDWGELERAVGLVSDAKLQIILLAASAGELPAPGPHPRIAEHASAAAKGVPIITGWDASVAALRRLGVARPWLVAAAPEEAEREAAYLRQHGLDPAGAEILDPDGGDASGLARLRDQVRRSVPARADGVYIASTRLETVGALDALEADLRRPVASTVQGAFWQALQRVGFGAPVDGFGRLLAEETVR